MPENEKIEVASRTYNACTNLIEENFDIEVNRSMRPKARFHLAITMLEALIEEKEERGEERTLDDFSKNEIRAVFEDLSLKILEKAQKKQKIMAITRHKFIRVYA